MPYPLNVMIASDEDAGLDAVELSASCFPRGVGVALFVGMPSASALLLRRFDEIAVLGAVITVVGDAASGDLVMFPSVELLYLG